MPRIDASLTLLYPDRATDDAMRAAAADGFTAYETWWPHPRPDPTDRRLQDFIDHSRRNGLHLVCLTGYSGAADERGLGTSVLPESVIERHFEALAATVTALRSPVVTMLYGNLRHSDRAGRVAAENRFAHLARSGHDPASAVRAAGGRLAHLQIADHPGRHEPGTGALDFGALGLALRATDYRGYIGLEYHPTGLARGPHLPSALTRAWDGARR
ncbi:TIM barrel protein [Nocardia noduli]|uniref:TIM barrel protein n=1 Tax=Nocardia noduli TaxID=2815722 RepID=UPI001C21FF20|nr:TIM barrel protein [Nocardia noduli]